MTRAAARLSLQRAVALRQAGDRAGAAAAAAEALVASPDDPDALHLAGVLAFEAGDAEGGARRIALALRRRPGDARFERSRAIVAAALGRRDEAIDALGRVRAAAPTDEALAASLADLLLSRAADARGAGRLAEALRDCEAAVAAAPRRAAALSDLALTWAQRGDDARAEATFRRAIALPAPVAEAAGIAANFGNWLRLRDRLDEARKFLETAVHLVPSDPGYRMQLGDAVLAIDRRSTVPTWHFARALEAPGMLDAVPPAMSQPIMSALYVSEDGVRHRAFAADWAASAGARTAPPPSPAAPDPGRRLRVGYVSGDLRRHSVANFILPVLEAHDRAAVEVHAYATAPEADDVTARIRAACDGWVEAADLDNAALAARIAADRIDVLIDLSGHTRHGRLAVFRARPAPLQLTWIGFAATTGLDCFDARITDSWADPPGLTEAHFSETLARLPSGFLAYRPIEALPAPSPRSPGAPTFASFAHAVKIGRRSLELWGRVLAAVPGSRLLLKPMAGDDKLVADDLRRMAREAGIAPASLELRRPLADWRDHLALYAEVDAVLDTLPYAGTTTTCEALWMGVPVVTRAGATHASRVGASLLNRAGLGELVAESDVDFVAIARRIAADPARRVAWRGGLRAQLEASALGAAPAVTRDLEALLRHLWAQRCRGEAPDPAGFGGAPGQR